MAKRYYPPLKIPVLSYDKIDWNNLSAEEFRFAISEAIIIDRETYLTRWINKEE